MDYKISQSPTPPAKTPVVEVKSLLDFSGAILAILDGKKVTREEWGDTRWYCLLHDDLLSIHRAGEGDGTIRPWIINNGDLGGLDWYVI